MKKRIVYLLALILIFGSSSSVFAKSKVGNATQAAIKKYKVGNYTGCLQDCQSIVKRDPSNAIAYYYMAMSYVQAGKKDPAIAAYSRVLSLNPKTKLLEYATTGKRCLETPDQCVLETGETTSDVDMFIATPRRFSEQADAQINQKRLDKIRNEINNDGDFDPYNLRQFKKFNNSSSIDSDKNMGAKKPTNDEIVAALKVLSDAGLNPYANTSAPVMAQGYPQSDLQSPELAQINALMGAQTNNNSNPMANMLPMMLAQGQNGNMSYSPQMIQAMVMGSMMPDFNLNMNEENK